MNGIMATMLTLALTGIVSGQQQFQQDRFSAFDGALPTRPTPEANERGFMPGATAPMQPSAQFVMTLDADVVQQFRAKGELSTFIEPSIRREIAEVIFGFPGSLRNSADANFFSIVPISRENNTLIFEFSESDLRTLESSTIRYRFAPEEIGQYDAIVVRLKGAGLGLDNPPSSLTPLNIPREQDRFATNPGSNLRDINPPMETRTPSTFPDNRLSDRTSGGFDNRLPMSDSRPPVSGGIGGDTNPLLGINPPSLGREPLSNSWRDEPTLDRGLDTRQPAVTPAPDQRRAEHLAIVNRELNDRENEIIRRERMLAEKESLLIEQQDFARRESVTPVRNTWNGPEQAMAQRNSGPSWDNRFASARDERLTGGTQPQETGSTRDAMLDNVWLAVNDGFKNLKRDNLTLFDRIESLESQRVLSDPFARDPAPNILPPAKTPDRVTRNFSPNVNNPSLSNYQTQINGPNNNPRDQFNGSPNMSGPLYFMLICSLGLNIYLGVISRNFYVRYNELADELRETFSASINS